MTKLVLNPALLSIGNIQELKGEIQDTTPKSEKTVLNPALRITGNIQELKCDIEDTKPSFGHEAGNEWMYF